MSEPMHAAVLVAPGRFELQKLPLREPGPQEVRVRLEGSGVCASNLPVWEGREWFTYPLEPGAPGHEGWGVIDAVGAGVTGLGEGTRVALLSYHAYADYDVAPASAVVSLPEALAGQPFPAEPLACAMNIFKRSDIQVGQTVAIIGIGFLGALLVQLAAQAGAHVIAITRRPYALKIAKEMGATHTIPMDDHWQIIEKVKELTSGEGCARVIEAVGKQWPLDLAAELTKERGKLIIAGYHQDGPREVNMQLWNWRGLDVINAHEREQEVYVQGMREAVRAVQEGRLNPAPLYTHCLPLERLDEALKLSSERPDGFFKALVKV